MNADSIVVNDSLKYYTKLKNRPVYGGGGIIPDLFVPMDTSLNYSYFNRLIAKNVIGEYVVNYVDVNRNRLKSKYSNFEKYKRDFTVTDAMIADIIKAGEKAGVPEDEQLILPIVPTMKRQIKALIARDLWGMNEMYQILNEENDILQAGYKALKDGTYERILE